MLLLVIYAPPFITYYPDVSGSVKQAGYKLGVINAREPRRLSVFIDHANLNATSADQKHANPALASSAPHVTRGVRRVVLRGDAVRV